MDGWDRQTDRFVIMSLICIWCFNFFYNEIEIYKFLHFADAFTQSDLQYMQVIHLLSECVFPGNWTHNLCTANAMLYHWATGTYQEIWLYFTWCLGHALKRIAVKRKQASSVSSVGVRAAGCVRQQRAEGGGGVGWIMGTQRDLPSVCGVEQRLHSCLAAETRMRLGQRALFIIDAQTRRLIFRRPY